MANIDITKRVVKTDYSMNQLHSHPVFEIYFLTKGSRLLIFSDRMYELTKPTVIIIPPNTLHKTEGGPFTRYNIFASPKALNKFEEAVLDKKSLQLIEPSPEALSELVGPLEKAIAQNDEKFLPYINEAVFSYFIYLLNGIEVSDNKGYGNKKLVPIVVLKVIKYFNDHLTDNITLDDVANEFFISKSTLNYNFKRYTGCSPMEYLLKLRLDTAKRMLTETDKSIDEISEKSGFSTPNYFGTIFKKQLGISPTAYRKNR